MKKDFWKVILLIVVGPFIAGCATLNGNVPFQYQPSIKTSDMKINKIVGINILVDERPQADISATKSIKDISEKVTSKILEDFKKSDMFDKVHIFGKDSDDFIIDGTIDRFLWKADPVVTSFIPFLNLIHIFGVPTYTVYGEAGITLFVKNAKTKKIIGKFAKFSQNKSYYTLYKAKAGEYGAELSESFRSVMKEIKEEMLEKL